MIIESPVLNLSATILSTSELSVLSKGLGFSPTNSFNMFQTLMDVNRFARKLTLRKHFLNSPDEEPANKESVNNREEENPGRFVPFEDQRTASILQSLQDLPMIREDEVTTTKRQESRFYPIQSRPAGLDTFQELVEKDLRTLHVNTTKKDSKYRNNITHAEKQALRNLSANEQIVIRSADKGGAIVVLDSELYRKVNYDILSDVHTYRALSYNPTSVFQNKIRDLLQEGVSLGVLTERMAQDLYVDHPIVPLYHSLPKVHKGTFPPPMRPIVAGIGSLNERLGSWVDAYLQPLVSITLSHLKDTKHVVTLMEQAVWEPGSTWLTCDVTALYPSVLHEVALAGLSTYLDTYSSYSKELKFFLLEATSYLLHHNFFTFDDKFFLQIRGAPMGAKFSPSLSNIYMSIWEENFLFSAANPYAPHIKWYGRYMDDLLLMWGSDGETVESMISWMNNNDMNLRFTFHHAANEIDFLDIKLVGDVAGGVTVLPFRKPTALNSILRASSCHPPHVTKNLPVGELVRLKRYCSDLHQYNLAQKETCSRLSERGYSEWSLTRAKNIVTTKRREDLLACSHKPKTDRPMPLTFITTHSPHFNEIKNIINKYLPILMQDVDFSRILQEPVRFSTKRAPTIGDRVSPSLFPRPKQSQHTWLGTKGFYRCGHRVCKACKHAAPGKCFASLSDTTLPPHTIGSYINCNTRNVVYSIECKSCHLQYIGHTSNPLKTRIRRHLSDITNLTAVGISAASKHFVVAHGGDVKDFIYRGIEKVHMPKRGGDIIKKLYSREAYWILTLNSRSPLGLNVRQDILYQY